MKISLQPTYRQRTSKLFLSMLLALAVVFTSVWSVGAANPITFVDSGQLLGTNSASVDVAMDDVDGDGDIDAFVANGIAGGKDPSNRVYINQGGMQGGTLGVFADSGQALGAFSSRAVELGDLDGDNDMDAFVANYGVLGNPANRVYINQGGMQGGTEGVFADSGQLLGTFNSVDVELDDLDGDNDLDALVINDGPGSQVYINQGGDQLGTEGVFVDSGQTLAAGSVAALGDVDGDGDLDAFVGVYWNPDRVYINQGGMQGGTEGVFVDSGQALPTTNPADPDSTLGVALGDLDGDLDLDAFVNNYGEPNLVYINQGGMQGGTEGVFVDSGQLLGMDLSRDVVLGDFDKDGDFDAFVANFIEPNRVYNNDGLGNFTDTGLALGTNFSGSDGVDLAKLDNDDLLDAFVANFNTGNRVFLNVTQVQVDNTPPTANASVSPIPNANGWHNSDVTVTWNWNDEVGGSGIDSANCTTSTTSSGEGNITLDATCKDLAGNTDTASYPVKIDKTPPVVSVTGVVDGTTYILGAVPGAACNTSDALSGRDTDASLNLSDPNPNATGTITATCAGALDNAGNSGSASLTYTVVTPVEAIDTLKAKVQALEANGTLNHGQANSLIQHLDNASNGLGRGRTVFACGRLQHFIDSVNRMVSTVPLNASTANDLITDAEAIRTALGC